MAKKYKNIFSQLQEFEKQFAHMEDRILHLEQQIREQNQLQRNHLIRVKNKEQLSDDFLLYGRRYHDLTPERAWKLYCDKDFDFIILDVSAVDFKATNSIPEAIHIPWEDLRDRFYELSSKTTPILIICEDGTKSVLACEFLVKRGYFNCNNISGGHKFWKGNQVRNLKEVST